MATVTVTHRPELTAEQAMEAFGEHFAGKYKVHKARLIGWDFVVKKSEWTGVGVKLKQEENSTTFDFSPFMPSWIVRALVGQFQWIRPGWDEMEEEVASFIESASEFK